jgi:putative ABC transport system ATP-binding protein
MIRLEKITKVFKIGTLETPVLHGIDLHIEKGEFTTIMAPSGAGKSTLMYIIGCLDRPTSGRYFFDGKEVETLSDWELSKIRNKKIGFVFQSYNLLPRTSAVDNVLLPLIYSDNYPGNPEEKAKELLISLGLGERLEHKPNELSGGQQQKIAIARALINEPRIILADEPTGNLDTRSGLEILSIFQKLHKEGKTIICITHDREVASHARKIIHMKDGRIESVEEVEKPKDAFSALYELKAK